MKVRRSTVWRGSDLVGRPDWLTGLSDADIAELDAAIRNARAYRAKPWELSPATFPLPGLADTLSRARTDLDEGRGFAWLRGIPVGRYDDEERRLALCGVMCHFGELIEQGGAAGKLVEVRDRGHSLTGHHVNVRGFESRFSLDFHRDGGDVTGLLSLSRAASGGLSRIVSFAAVYQAIAERRPDLRHLLLDSWTFDRRGLTGNAGDRTYHNPLCVLDHDLISILHSPGNVLTARRHGTSPPLTNDQRTVIKLLFEIAEEPGCALEESLEAGDLQLVNNSAVLHGRTAYEDAAHGEPRVLLRAWCRTPSTSRCHAREVRRH